MELRPFADQMFVEPLDKDVSPAGLVIVRTETRAHLRGRIVQIGSKNPENLAVGDIVLYEQHQSTVMKPSQDSDQEWVVVPIKAAIARVEDDTTGA